MLPAYQDCTPAKPEKKKEQKCGLHTALSEGSRRRGCAHSGGPQHVLLPRGDKRIWVRGPFCRGRFFSRFIILYCHAARGGSWCRLAAAVLPGSLTPRRRHRHPREESATATEAPDDAPG